MNGLAGFCAADSIERLILMAVNLIRFSESGRVLFQPPANRANKISKINPISPMQSVGRSKNMMDMFAHCSVEWACAELEITKKRQPAKQTNAVTKIGIKMVLIT